MPRRRDKRDGGCRDRGKNRESENCGGRIAASRARGIDVEDERRDQGKGRLRGKDK